MSDFQYQNTEEYDDFSAGDFGGCCGSDDDDDNTNPHSETQSSTKRGPHSETRSSTKRGPVTEISKDEKLKDKNEIKSSSASTEDDEIDFMTADFSTIDFRNAEDTIVKKKEKKEYTHEYDHNTTKTFKTLRLNKMDPITAMPIPENLTPFEVPNMWDPITGEFLKTPDPFGPIVFNPLGLIREFYAKRCSHVWNPAQDGADGYYEGYPGEGLGTGETFFVKSRGHYPEWFVFRVPIKNCYIEKDADRSVPRMGPKLSRDDIVRLYEFCKKATSQQLAEFSLTVLPNIVQVYDTYMEAISLTPDISKIEDPDPQNAVWRANIAAAQKLAGM